MLMAMKTGFVFLNGFKRLGSGGSGSVGADKVRARHASTWRGFTNLLGPSGFNKKRLHQADWAENILNPKKI